ncbi:FAD-binding oxidoreductase [Chloroflexota bacterium]
MNPINNLNSFRNSLAGIVSPGNISDDSAALEGYSGDYSFVTGGSPLLAVYPESREEVQGIVRLANENGVPLVPVSSGPPRFHGDTVPAHDSVIIDFSKMKRIMNIDPVNRAAMIETGVTYGELIPELRKQGLKLITPLLPRASKSVVTSRLEREPTLVPKYQFDYVDPLLTLEVVYGTGDDFRTGSASGPGKLEDLKSDKVNPWGPGSVDYFRFLSGAQGTMGLVTWIVTKVEVLPTISKLYFIPVEDINKLTAPMNLLLRKRVVDECLALNNTNLATILAENMPGDYEELKAALPEWMVMVCISGYDRRPEERVSIQEKYLLYICRDLNLKATTSLPGAEGKEEQILELLSGVWEKTPYWKLRRKGSSREIFFLSPFSKVPELIECTRDTAARHGYPVDEISCYVQPMVQGRGCHIEFTLPCDESNAAEMAMVEELFTDASEILMKNGAYFSRPYGQWADMVYSGNTELVMAFKKLKGIFDPNNILNPGKLCFKETMSG